MSLPALVAFGSTLLAARAGRRNLARLARLGGEVRSLSGIAGPLILSSLVSMGVSIVDLSMMSAVGSEALAAGAVVSDFYSIFYYFFGGMIMSLSSLIARARGAGNRSAVRQYTHGGFMLVLLFGICGLCILWNADRSLLAIGIDPQLVHTGLPYARMMGFTFIAMSIVNFLYFFLSAHGNSRAIFLASLFGLPINALGNYALMFGNFGMPEMGLAGAGLASLLAACLMVAFMLAAMAKQKYFRRYALLRFSGVRFDRLREIVSVGLPISVSNLGEMGVFMISTVIMGRFGAEAVAAHVVVLRLAGVLYSVPLGYAQAATVRIGFAIGAGQMNRATLAIRAAVFLALAQGFLFMAAILLFRHEIASLFAGSGEMAAGIVAQSGMFLLMLALAQPLECLGVVGNGILRGFKITRQPMYFSVFAFWGVGFVGGMTLAFNFGLAGVGIWAGLGAGSSLFGLLIGSRLLRQWKQREFSTVAA